MLKRALVELKEEHAGVLARLAMGTRAQPTVPVRALADLRCGIFAAEQRATDARTEVDAARERERAATSALQEAEADRMRLETEHSVEREALRQALRRAEEGAAALTTRLLDLEDKASDAWAHVAFTEPST